MCKAKSNIQLSGLSSERREHQRQKLIHSWILWKCSNHTNKCFKTKKTRGKAKQTQAELSALKGRGCCSATAQCSPVQAVGFRLVSDRPLVCPEA